MAWEDKSWEEMREGDADPLLDVGIPSCLLRLGERKVMALNLGWNVTDAELEAFGSQGGTVERARVEIHGDSRRSKGWG